MNHSERNRWREIAEQMANAKTYQPIAMDPKVLLSLMAGSDIECEKCGGLRVDKPFCGCGIPSTRVSIEKVAGGPDTLVFDQREVARRT